MDTEHERAAQYCSSLNDIRLRLMLVESLCESTFTTGSTTFDNELAAINLRKILEHIAFGSLTANSTAYTAAYDGIASVWRAKKLLDKLEFIHSDFYPRPLQIPNATINQGSPRHLHFDYVKHGYLTRDEFVELYDTCSEVIHSRNPFKENTVVDFRLPIIEWAGKIRSLLALHLFRLSGLPQLWIGELQGPDGQSHVAVASSI